MTDHADRSVHDVSPGDAQARLLDGFLDDLRTGAATPPLGLDPVLAQVARLAHDLGALPHPPATQRAAKARTWEHLMQPAMTSSVIAFPAPTTTERAVLSRHPSGPSFTAPIPPEPVRHRTPSRLRRIGHRSLGLVATLTLVALVALSGLALYLSAPRSAPSPSSMRAGISVATPSASPDGSVLLPNRTTCLVQPRDYDQTLALLEPYLSGRSEVPTPWLSAHQIPRQVALPAGPAPDAATAAEIATVWGRYQGCQLSREYRRSASLFTDDGLVRYYLITGGAIDHDPGLLAYEPVADADLPELDEPSSRAMSDLRLFDDGHRAAAFISSGWTDPATPPLANNIRRQFGHIFFVREGDRWLIDELTWWGTGEG